MALNTRLDLRQTQSLVMTPQLQQAIKLLQMSNVEVIQFVEEALEQNPLLERAEGERETEGDVSPVAEAADSAVPMEDVGLTKRDEAPLDVPYEDLWTEDSVSDAAMPPMGDQSFERTGSGSTSFDSEDSILEQTLSRDVTLQDHLQDQLYMELSDPVDRMIGRHLIDMVDEAGYLGGDFEGLSRLLNCPPERIETTLARLHGFDPPGVFARNLAECLALQLKDRNRLDPVMQTLLDNLDLLAKHDMVTLRRLCDVNDDDLAEMVAEIRALNPKPGLAFDTSVAQSVTPDVLMRTDTNGGSILELNSETLPRVLINTQYYARLNRGTRNKDEKAYITECFQSASWLVRSLHQRANTILKVAAEIVRQQDAFFAHGVQFLKPLVLRDIAEAISMHESTVSRVTTNKYISTPRGVHELKYFFTSAIARSGGGESHSAESVRFRIRMLIDNEKVDDVLSDDRLVEVLQREGIEIARRTVAKYRESMRISSSVQRRREKMAAKRSTG